MTFLVALQITLIMHVAFVLRRAKIRAGADGVPPRATATKLALHSAFAAAAMLSGAGLLWLTEPFTTLHGPYRDHLAWFFLCGTVFTILSHALRLLVWVKERPRRSLAAVPLIGGLLGCYLFYAVFDHLRFFADRDHTGIVGREIGSVAGISCAMPYLLVRTLAGKHHYDYRCPNSMMLGHPLGHPFVPWPGYREGSSRELKDALEQLYGNSERITR